MKRLIILIVTTVFVSLAAIAYCQSNRDTFSTQEQSSERSNRWDGHHDSRVETGRQESRETFPTNTPPKTDSLVVKAAVDIAKIIYGF
jgi:flagellar basal body-associated protein FliL